MNSLLTAQEVPVYGAALVQRREPEERAKHRHINSLLSVPMSIMFSAVTLFISASTVLIRQFSNFISDPTAIVIHSFTSLSLLFAFFTLQVPYWSNKRLKQYGRSFPYVFDRNKRLDITKATEFGGHSGTYVDGHAGLFAPILAVGACLYFFLMMHEEAVNPSCEARIAHYVWPCSVIVYIILQLILFLDPKRCFHAYLYLVCTNIDRLRQQSAARRWCLAHSHMFAVRLAIGLLIAAAVGFWLHILSVESINDYCHEENYTSFLCNITEASCYPKILGAEYFLPLSAEFALFMVQEYALWYTMTMYIQPAPQPSKSYILPSRKDLLSWKSIGWFAGGLITLIQGIIFVRWLKSEKTDQATKEIFDIIQHVPAIILAVFVGGTVYKKKVGEDESQDQENISPTSLSASNHNTVHRKNSLRYEERVHLLVLLFTFFGFAGYFALDIIGDFNDNEQIENFFYLILFSDITTLLDVFIQVVLVWYVINHHIDQVVKDSNLFRQCLIYLFFDNLVHWFVNSYEYVEVNRNPYALNVFGLGTWTAISHITWAPAIYFRFHMAETFYHFLKVHEPQPQGQHATLPRAGVPPREQQAGSSSREIDTAKQVPNPASTPQAVTANGQETSGIVAISTVSNTIVKDPAAQHERDECLSDTGDKAPLLPPRV